MASHEDYDTKAPIEATPSNEKQSETIDEKKAGTVIVKGDPEGYDGELPKYSHEHRRVVDTAEEITTAVLHVEDDPTLNPWTFRTVFLGLGFAVFGSTLQEIFYFKPQTIYVSVVFLTVLAYILGEALAHFIPRKGAIGRLFNPGPFNSKEHACITLMASAAAQSALSTEALAAQQLFYGGFPSRAAAVFITLSSQLIGYGVAGLLRDVLVYPSKMLWPYNLPVASLLESLHRDKAETKRKLKLFYWVFIAIFLWEIVPEWIFPVLEGFSIFCLANQHSLVFTNLFGGASGNEGLGFLAVSFDWQYIASLGSPMWYPLYSLTNSLIGYLLCIVVFMAVYYGNVWGSQKYPFLAQELFYPQGSNGTYYNVYNQTLILNSDFEIDKNLLAQEGTPALTGTYLVYLITSNMGFTATFVHMLLWNYDDIKAGWAWAAPSNLAKLFKKETWQFWKQKETPEERLERKQNDPTIDPHYKVMLKNLYREVPLWWWGSIVVIAFIMGIVCLYVMKSTLPWWGFVMSLIFSFVAMLFFGAQFGITGFQFNTQPFFQMIAGYMFPGRPLANLYFTCYTYNALQMGQVLARDLKLAQYVHLSPRSTFTAQILGCVVGALMNYSMMLTIVDNQSTILTSIAGTNIWSGQNVQQFNTLAIAWSIASDMFSFGAKYQWVTIVFLLGFVVPVPFWLAYRYTGWRVFRYLNTSIILWYMGWLFVGINSSILSYFAIGFLAQGWLRIYRPQWFVDYNYLLSAALDGGTQVMVFILTFAVFGGSGNAVKFPTWAGNPDTSVHNLDYCMVNPAVSS
ncbi:OPT family small oligopeptide transporter [Verruconis gallopava]|uniref:OPT family small oligopeptide transporter n=1 Tax=Verruconis gallopava TaxID=253628 RepID=A0A0D1XED3_9PEZI|nr:OPT family small oligopeptide transporter [Verruconis gallopava]KIW00506.1 OPT family small oligopeptide transporter [Verruconis gallopava]